MKSRRLITVYDVLRRYKKAARRLQRASMTETTANRKKAEFLRRRLQEMAQRLNPLANTQLASRLAAIAFGGLAATGLNAQTPTIATVSPSTNALNVVTSSNISITFSTEMNASTLDENNIRVFGSQTGFLSDEGVFSGNPTRVFNPTDNFLPNEIISVSLTTGATSTAGTALLRANVFQFRTEVQFGKALFDSRILSLSSGAEESAVGDLDGDGDLDLLVVKSGQNLIWLNDGTGTFTESSFGQSRNSRDVALGDLDADGDLDALIVNYNQSNAVWLNNGDGTFSSSDYNAGRSSAIEIGDLDGDGDLDAVHAVNEAEDEIWFNNGDGTFSSSTFGTAAWTGFNLAKLWSTGTALGDLDNDGDLDVVVTKFLTFINSYRQDIWLNDGAGNLTPQTFNSSIAYFGVELLDLDGDSDLDLLAYDTGFPDLYLNNGDGTFSSSQILIGEASNLAFGDIDADGDLDAVMPNGVDSDLFGLNNGSGSFNGSNLGANAGAEDGNGILAEIADFDGDGDLDVLIHNSDAEPVLWINDPPPRVTGFDPDKNDVSHDRNEAIRVEFLQTMNSSTLTVNAVPTQANLIVYGSQTGHLGTSATVSFEDDQEIAVISPAADFKPGERIWVTVTGATKLEGRGRQDLEKATVYSFIAGVDGGTGVFSSNTFGNGESTNIDFGDLDGDGDLDAILTNYYSPDEIWLNNGDATFTTSTLGGNFSADVALGDLDGDGDLDAVIAKYFGYAQEIWLNNGDGSFSTSTFGGGGSHDLAIGDLDGDGDLDVVIANYSNEAQEVWLNNGDGAFSSSTFGGGDSRGVALGDLDGDCDLDLVIANDSGADHIWLNNGDASFSSSTFGAGDGRAVAMGDLDGDGDLDVVVARNNTADYVWVNNGDASFGLRSLGNSATLDIGLGDLDGDGDLDIISAVGGSPQDIWRNDGGLTFSKTVLGSGDSRGLDIADLDGDGDLDVAIANYFGSGREIWINAGAPSITSVSPANASKSVAQDENIEVNFNLPMDPSSLISSPVSNATVFVYGSESADISTNASLVATNGNLRLIVDPAANFRAGEEISVSVTGASVTGGIVLAEPIVFKFRAEVTSGSGNFQSSGFGGAGVARGVAFGDLDGDGDLDAISGSYFSSNRIRLNNGDGSFATSNFGLANGQTQGLDIGDLDGDGDLDAIIVNGAQRANEIWLNNGDGTFSSSTFHSADAFGVKIGDLDGDGDLDAFLVTDSNNDFKWLNNGDGTFSASSPGTNPNVPGTRDQVAIALGDLDNDGDLDAVTAMNQSNRGSLIFRNDGNGEFSQSQTSGFNANAVALGDLNNDGWLDAVWAIESGADRIRLNNGSGGLSGEVDAFGEASSSESVAIGDLDGDGDLDLFFGKSADAVHVFLNNGDATFTSQTLAGKSAHSIALGDIDNDNDLDAVSTTLFGNALWTNQAPAPPPPAVIYPLVTELSPATNALAALVNSDIQISFSTTMSVTSLSATNINISSNFSAYLSTSGGVFSGVNPRTFDPTDGFKPGELISVTVTGAQSLAGVTMSHATVYSFRAAVTGGNATFDTSHLDTGTFGDIDLGDLDGDGDLDAIVAHGAFGGQRVWLNNGDDTFATSSAGGGRATGVAIGDLDNDGDLDAIVARAGYSQELWLNDGSAGFAVSTLGAAGGNSRAVALGDLDGDGDIDALIANESGQAQDIWLNNGDATFDISTVGGSRARDIAIGDIDGDGDLDAIVAGYASTNELMLNNGDGSFAVSSFGETSAERTGVDIGDLDGDGDLDAVMAVYDGEQEIWTNDGQGTLTSSTMPAWVAQDVQLGDLDGDGDLDAFFAAYGELSAGGEEGGGEEGGGEEGGGEGGGEEGGGEVGGGEEGGGGGRLPEALPSSSNQAEELIWLNDGSGTFSSFVVGHGESSAVSLGDLDGDGDLDAIIVKDELGGAPAQLWLNGAPVVLTAIVPGINASNVAADSDIDVSFNTAMNSNTLTASTNTNNAELIVHAVQSGHITPQATVSYPNSTTANINPSSDFKPGETVMVTVTNAQAMTGQTMAQARVQEFRVAVPRGAGVFQAVTFANAGQPLEHAEAGDFNGDGFVDVMYLIEDDRFVLQLNAANGNIDFTSQTFSVNEAAGFDIGDIDGDGDLDMFSAANTQQTTWFNNGQGSFTSGAFVSIDDMRDVQLGDLDGDGDLDAFLAGDSEMAVLFNDGSGVFSGTTTALTEEASGVELGDLDGDGDLDALLAGYYDGNRVMLNQGDGSFVAGSSYGDSKDGEAVLGDLDGDGDLDAIIANDYDGHNLLVNDGSAAFTIITLVGSGFAPSAELGDMDGDGDLDILIGYGDKSTDLWTNDGGLSFTREILSGGNARSLATADFDNDDDLDFAEGPASGPFRILENTDVPLISVLSTNCTIATSASLALSVSGENFVTTQAKVTILNSDGSDSGSTLALSILNGGTDTQFQTVIPAGYVATSGTLTLTVTGTENLQATTTITVHPSIDLTGNVCNFAGIDQEYVAEPVDNSATHVWTITNGVIIGSSSGSQILVDWNDAENGTLNVVRTYSSGCTTASMLRVTPGEIPTVQDLAFTAKNEAVTVAVLSNDFGNLSLLSVSTPDDGTATTSGNNVIYTPATDFVGIDRFEYTVENSSGCSVTGAAVVFVGFGANYKNNLIWIEREKDRVGGVRGLRRVHGLDVSPDAKHVYAVGRSDHSIVQFNRSVTTGSLTYVKRYRHGRNGISRMRYPENIVVSGDGRNIYVVSYSDNSVVVFDRDQLSGDLSFVEFKRNGQVDAGGTISQMSRPRSLVLSQDDANLYVGGQSSNGLVVFERSSTGTLTFQESFKDGIAGVDGLKGVLDVAVSPDDAHVYAAATAEDKISIFARSSTNGTLTYLDRIRDGVDSVDGIQDVIGLVFDPTGSNMYAAGLGDDALVTFERHSTDGSLSFVEKFRDGLGGVNGLDGARDIVIDPFGSEVYVAGSVDNAIATFARGVDGTLCFSSVSIDGVNGVDGIRGVRGLSLSPDGLFLYAAGYGENSVAAFQRNYRPIAIDDTGLSVPAGNSLTISVLTNDFDADGDALTVSAKTDGALGTVTIVNAATQLEYQAAGSSGNDSFTYTISDGNGGSSTATVNIQVSSNGRKSGTSAPRVELSSSASDLRVSPNPMAGGSTVSFNVNKASRISARIVALTGRELWSADLGSLSSGSHAFVWQGSDAAGQALPSGMYYLELVVEAGTDAEQRLSTEIVIKR